MRDKIKYNKYKWITLISFAVMYNFVYVGRFNINALMPEIAEKLAISQEKEKLILMSLFFSYAIGSIINGFLADKYGAKKIILIGGVVSIYANLTMVIANSWYFVFLLQFVNGFFQSMMWVGGISILAKWWRPGERGIGVGIANFFSGLSHVTAYVLPLVILTISPSLTWRGLVTLPMYVWGSTLLLFAMVAVDSPEKKNLKPYRAKEKSFSKKGRPRRVFIAWCSLAFLSSMCRYGLLSWIPIYFKGSEENNLISENFSNLTLPIGMALGTLIITWLGGSKFNNNKGIVIVWAAALCGTLIIVIPMVEIGGVALMGIFFTGFFLYGINGMLWLYAMEAGGKSHAGAVAGILNGCAYLGAGLEGIIFPFINEFTGSIIGTFVAMELLCVAMIIVGVTISKKDTLVELEILD